jgi:hypothetical protein
MNSHPLIQRSLPLLFLLLFSVPLFFHNIHDTHSPGGDDYAQYIKEAQNIAAGKPYYQSGYVFNKYNNCYSPPQYPPGFPLLLAPVVKHWGIAIRPMCYFNTFIAIFILFGLYFYFRKYMSWFAALLLAIVISYSQCMMDLKQEVLSDETSMLFVLLYLIARNAKTFSWQRITLLILFATMAILIRTQSILLLFAEVVFLCLSLAKTLLKEKKLPAKRLLSEPSLYVVAGCLALTFILNKTLFYCPASAAGFYVDFLKITLQKGIPSIVRDNVVALITSVTNFFHYDTDHGMRTAIVTLMESAGLVFCCIGFLMSIMRRLCFDDIFFLFVCAMVLYYPIHDPRYFFPVMPVVFYYCYISLAKIVPAITTIRPRYIALLLAFTCLFAGMRYLRTTTLPPFGYVPEAKDRQAFNYITTHVNDSDIIICSRPHLTTLYTNKRCMIHAWQYPMDINKKVFDSVHAKYLLMNGIVDDYYETYLHTYEHPTDSVAIAPGYVLYTLR